MPRAKRPSELLPSGEYERMLAAQAGKCAIPGCRRTPKARRFHIDHEHVPGWADLPMAERLRYVRGLVCYWHNRLMPAGVKPAELRAMADYLEGKRVW